jgi:hypothetical protein
MKFFIVTCVKESRKTVYQLFKQANINAFSSTDVIGFKDNQEQNPLEEWFAHGDEQFDSEMIFSFTSDANARKGMSLVQEHNESHPTKFPIRVFIVPVETSSYSS